MESAEPEGTLCWRAMSLVLRLKVLSSPFIGFVSFWRDEVVRTFNRCLSRSRLAFLHFTGCWGQATVFERTRTCPTLGLSGLMRGASILLDERSTLDGGRTMTGVPPGDSLTTSGSWFIKVSNKDHSSDEECHNTRNILPLALERRR
jgi:hypothetical protein